MPEEEHSIGFKTPEEDFHSEGFKTDVTEAFVAAMTKKAAVLVGNRRYFGWKGVGFQCGVCYSSAPTHIRLTLCSYQESAYTCKLSELPPGTSKGLLHFVQHKGSTKVIRY